MKVDNDKKIKLYAGDNLEGLIKPTEIKNVLGHSFTIAEHGEVHYEELLQRAFQSAFERNPNYFEDDRVTCFLYWYDDFLIDMGSFTWSYNEKFENSLFLSHFFYTRMTKYSDVLHETIFERKAQILVLKTTRPVIKKIVDHLKKNKT